MMSNRDDYFDLDNFDESKSYRRRHPQSSRSSSSGRPVYNTGRNRRRRRRRNRKRTRNRILIVSFFILIIVLVIVLFSFMIRGCGNSGSDSGNDISTDTAAKQEQLKQATPDEAVKPTSAGASGTAGDDLSPSFFKTPVIEDDNTEGYSAYSIYVWHNTGFELFGSDEARAKTYADTINGFADKLTGINVYDMVIPNHTEMGLPQRLKESEAYSTSQADNLKNIYAGLNKNVTAINPYNYLADHNKEYIYFKSDHHWTGLGAYYAYKAFADTLKMPALSLDDCTEQTIDGFTGTFMNTASGLDTDTVHYWEFPYSVTMDITTEYGEQHYDSPYYQNATEGSLTYGVFIMGDNPLTVLKSGSEKAEEGRKLAVVKESYGNALVPYFTYNFSEVHIMDLRTFRDTTGTDFVSYCRENGITDVLFANGVMSANTQIQLDSMSALFN